MDDEGNYASTTSYAPRPLLPGQDAQEITVNVARGALVVDTELIALIDNGHLSGATLDVFRDEPLPAEHPFWHHPRIVLTPHVSAVTLVEESVAQIAGKIRQLEAGLPITGIVDRERGY